MASPLFSDQITVAMAKAIARSQGDSLDRASVIRSLDKARAARQAYEEMFESAGWKLVPAEPSVGMVGAARKQHVDLTVDAVVDILRIGIAAWSAPWTKS
jgi:hypothetical protein